MIIIKKQIEKLYGFEPDETVMERLKVWHEMFIEYNSHTNLMGKRDVPLIFQKHLLDSLAIVLFPKFNEAKILLDVGTGGGFPALILAMFYPELKIYAMDSVQKKVNFIKNVKAELSLDNLEAIASRAENFPSLNADILTSRAVGKISLVWKNARHHLKSGGYFISYKALMARDEARELQKLYPAFPKPEFLSYRLPLSEHPTRTLVVFKRP